MNSISKLPGQVVDLLLSPQAFNKYKLLFKKLKLDYIVSHENIQEIINVEAKDLAASRIEGKVVNTYPRYADLVAWINSVAAANSYASIYSAGKSNQGRDLPVLKIRIGNPTRRIWFDCGIHAREWISPATCVSLIDKFTTDYNNGVAEVVSLLNTFELHFLPLLNPDGYEYSQVTDRYWRKNRKTNAGSTCVGVDLNRNFPNAWLTGGSSTDPCSDTHAGPSAGSEPETQAVVNAVKNSNLKWDAFLTLHSYGNWFLTAWGNTTALPPHYPQMTAVGNLFKTAVQAVYGEIFTVGSTANLLYIATGASSDWGYDVMGVINSYTIELRPRNGVGVFGFALAATQIPQVGNEIYAGIKTLMRNI